MQLLQHFKELTIHPKNAQELKGLILQLAIQGKLTANWRRKNPTIESAFALLEKSKKEKARLMESKLIRKEKALPSIIKEEIPYELPESWVWSKLGDLIAMYNGRAFKKSEWSENGLPIIRIQNLNKKTAPYNYFNGEIEDRHLIKKGTFLISWSGTPGTSFGAFIWNGFDGALNQHINKCEFYSPEIFDEFIKRSINSQLYKLIDQAQGGAGLKHVTKGILNNLLLPLPPLEEQKEIVNVVETLFKEVEQLEKLTVERLGLKEGFVTSALHQLSTNNVKQEWKHLQEHFKSFFNETTNIKKLRETALQLAVQGKLTRDWRASHPELVSGSHHASQLLKSIQEEKAQLIAAKKIKKEKALPPIIKKDIPYEIPDCWVWCRLGKISDIIAGASFKSGDFNKSGGVRCIKITNAGVRSFVETNDYLPKGFDELYSNYLIKEGDLILALTRPYIKDGLKISICPATYNDSLLNQRVASIRSMSNNIYHPYIFSFIRSPKVLNYYKSKFDDKSQQPNMKMGDITDLLISLPPFEEQKAIVQKVNALMSLCDSLEQQVQQSQEYNEQLMQSVLRDVFEN